MAASVAITRWQLCHAGIEGCPAGSSRPLGLERITTRFDESGGFLANRSHSSQVIPERASFEGAMVSHDLLDELIIDRSFDFLGSVQGFCSHGDDEWRKLTLLHSHLLGWKVY